MRSVGKEEGKDVSTQYKKSHLLQLVELALPFSTARYSVIAASCAGENMRTALNAM
jgi:hypothetical protein